MRPRRKPKTWWFDGAGFRELRLSCLLNQRACATFLGVALRTVRNWDRGRTRVPWAAVRLMRLYRVGELDSISAAWTGWLLRGERLISPGGREFRPHQMSYWANTAAMAELWRKERRAAGGAAQPRPQGRMPVALPVGTRPAEPFPLHLASPCPAEPLSPACRPRPSDGEAEAAGRRGDCQIRAEAACAAKASAVASKSCSPGRQRVALESHGATPWVPSANRGLKPTNDGILTANCRQVVDSTLPRVSAQSGQNHDRQDNLALASCPNGGSDCRSRSLGPFVERSLRGIAGSLPASSPASDCAGAKARVNACAGTTRCPCAAGRQERFGSEREPRRADSRAFGAGCACGAQQRLCEAVECECALPLRQRREVEAVPRQAVGIESGAAPASLQATSGAACCDQHGCAHPNGVYRV